jgi:hypothetical protein
VAVRSSALGKAVALAAAFAVFGGPLACDDSKQGGADSLSDASGDVAASDAPDVGDLTGRSIYSLTVTLPDGTVVPFTNRELTGLETWYSFGSAHIGTAVAFTVSEPLSFPQNVTITLDFGKIVGSPEHPVDTPSVGEYPLDDSPPAVEIAIALQEYKSRLSGSEGEIVLTEWGTETGQVIAGTVSGTIAAVASGQLPITVDGWFHFTLPTKGDFNP